MTLYNHFYLLFTKNKTLISVKVMVISLVDILLLIPQCYIYIIKQSEASKKKIYNYQGCQNLSI